MQRPALGVFKNQTENHVVGTQCEGVNDEGGQVHGGQLTWGLLETVVRVCLYSQKMSESFGQGYVLWLKFLENHLVSVWGTECAWGRRGNQGDRRGGCLTQLGKRGWELGLEWHWMWRGQGTDWISPISLESYWPCKPTGEDARRNIDFFGHLM